jgi:hypothetical protein
MPTSRPLNPGEPPAVPILYRALEDALELLERMPLTDPRRGELARRIRAIEEAIDGLQPF